MPRTGCFKSLITLSRFFSLRKDMALLASPTPGKITLSAELISFASAVTRAEQPNLSNAIATD
jgi:hypothetical protein